MTVGRLRDLLLRFVIFWFIEAGCLVLIQWLLPGVSIQPTSDTTTFGVAMSAALLLGLVNVFVRPVVLLMTLPLNNITLGLPLLVIDAWMLYLVGRLLPGFHVDTFLTALLAALVLAVVNTVTMKFRAVDDDDTFFELAVRRLARAQQPATPREGRGIVMLEIDGLSYRRMKLALERGLMPGVRELIERGTHKLSYFDCGLPSQTSSCQAGIMYGCNDDIPAFRWYDKKANRMIVSNHFQDAFDLNRRYAHGQGLLRGGASINNLMAGDAAETLFTMSTLSGTGDDRSRRTQDLYLLSLNPYFFIRSVVLTVADIFLELAQNVRQQLHQEEPRMNRFHHGYPFLRAVTNVLLRELSTAVTMQAIIRGVPAIYTTFYGYDEVAHFAGPDSPDAFGTLRAYDGHIRRIRRTIERYAGRPYDLFLLSDHGQTPGRSFAQRYRETLPHFMSRLAADEDGVASGSGAQAGPRYALALAAELQAVGEQAARGSMGRAAVRGTQRVLDRGIHGVETPAVVAPHEPIVVCCSGNFANAYFRLSPDRVCLDELDAAYPGLVDGLVQHEGIGFIVGFVAPDHPVMFGTTGSRDLVTGQVTGDDPVGSYGDPAIRAAQIRRVASFPSAGDLLINSTFYPDGTVASFEDQVGSHGGLGGEQTTACFLHPADLVFDPGRLLNSADVFPVLNGRRALTGPPYQPEPAFPALHNGIDAFSLGTLWAGMRRVRQTWRRAWQALVLNPRVYREVARDVLATGQAVTVLAVTLLVVSLVDVLITPGALPARAFLGNLVSSLTGFLVLVWLAYRIAGFSLGDRPQRRADFARTFRTMAFANTPAALNVFGLLPGTGFLFRLVAGALGLVATYFALHRALNLNWWQSVLLPLFGLVVFSVVSIALLLIVQSTTLTAEVLLQLLGLAR